MKIESRRWESLDLPKTKYFHSDMEGGDMRYALRAVFTVKDDAKDHKDKLKERRWYRVRVVKVRRNKKTYYCVYGRMPHIKYLWK